MKHSLLYILMTLCLCSINLKAQIKDYKLHQFAFYAGVGPNYYFNNLAISKDQVNPWNYSLTTRLMWEPGHLLSLGIESGYYRLYSVNYSSSALGSGNIKNAAIPLQLVVSMKYLKNCYANFSMGQSYLLTEVTNSSKGKTSASSFSLADFGITLGYNHVFKSRFSIGTELKFYNSSKYNDNNISIVFLTGYHF